MNKKFTLPAVLILIGLVLRFVFTGMGFIAYALFFAAALIIVLRICKKSAVRRAICAVTALGLLYFIIVEVPIVKASGGNPDADFDYIIVLGAAVHGDTPSLSLIERMSAARDYMAEHPDTVAIVSGGQGSDENLSEAQAMYNWLTAEGIQPERILLEDKATSTLENLEFSFEIIRSRGDDPARNTAIVTSEYHIYRAQLISRSLGVQVGAVAAHTTYVNIMLNYFIREAFGVTYQWVLG